MLNCFIVKNLEQSILDSCKNNIEIYKSTFRSYKSNGIFKYNKSYEDVMIRSRDKYFGAVYDDLRALMRRASSKAQTRFDLVLSCPALIGLEDKANLFPFDAGSSYAFAYYALTKSKAKPASAIRMNDAQNDFINHALYELDEA